MKSNVQKYTMNRIRNQLTDQFRDTIADIIFNYCDDASFIIDD